MCNHYRLGLDLRLGLGPEVTVKIKRILRIYSIV